jgi:hypothetical protein
MALLVVEQAFYHLGALTASDGVRNLLFGAYSGKLVGFP